MDLIFWLIVGIVAGLLARSVVPGEGSGGILSDLVIGIIGAFIGGWVFKTFFHQSYGGWIGSTFVAFVGAVIFLVIIRAISGNRRAI